MRSHLATTLLPMLLLTGCGPSPEAPVCSIGSFDTQFTPFADGQDVELISGVQGGFHIWVSFLGVGLKPDGAMLEAVGSFADTGQKVTIDITRALDASIVDPVPDGWVLANERLIMATTNPADVVGHVVRVDAALTASGGATTACTVDVTIVDNVDELALPSSP